MLRLEQFIALASEHVENAPSGAHFFMFYADITNFKRVNEQYGIDKASELLDDMGSFLTALEHVVLCERVFSDRFLFLARFDNETGAADVQRLGQERVKEFLDVQRKRFPSCVISIACGMCPMTDDNILHAIDASNYARKEAKRRGASAPVIYDWDAFSAAHPALKTESEISDAWYANRVVFTLQPKVNLKTGEIIGAEALARLAREDGSLIMPTAFMPVFEDNGFVLELDKQMLRLVCAFLAERIGEGLPVVPVSLNLSRLHVYDSGTPDELHGIVSEYALPPSLIEFELTETVLTKDITVTRAFIDRLRALGYMVSIDDFGSGYAGISLLQELVVDTMKLDRRFLDFDEPYKSRNLAIVPNLISTAQRLDINIICEGVESVDHCEYLVSVGCESGQGNYFGGPVTPEEFYDTFARGNGRFPLPYIHEDGGEAAAEKSLKDRKSAFRVIRHVRPIHIVAFFVCATLIMLTVLGVMVYQDRAIRDMFIDSVEDSLDNFVYSRKVETKETVSRVTQLSNTLASLISERGTTEFADTYMHAFNSNSNNDGVVYEFKTEADIRALLENPATLDIDHQAYQLMQQGNVIVSPIVYSEELGMYWFGVGAPVYIDGQFIGAIKATIPADRLISSDDYDSPFGEISCVMISDGAGSMLYSDIHQDEIGENVYDHVVARYGVEAESFDNSGTMRLIAEDGSNVYISQISLDVNDWVCTVVFTSPHAHSFTGDTQRLVRTMTLAITSVVVMTIGVIIALFFRVRASVTSEQRRYALLAQFSDTILFDYNCRRDIMSFTGNTGRNYDIGPSPDGVQPNFQKSLATSNFVHPADQSIVRQMLGGMLIGGKNECRVRIRSRDGKYVWCLMQYKFTYRAGQIASVLGKLINIDEAYQREQRFRNMAMYDAPTGLYNKASATLYIRERIAEEARGALLIVDMDGLKQINDSFGHATGDEAISIVAACLKQTFRSTDITGRIGGDEFIVYLRELADRRKISEKLDSLIADIRARDDSLSVSIGVACYPECGDDYETLFEAADKALYTAKFSGKNRYEFAPAPK